MNTCAVEKIQQYFGDLLNTVDGRKCQLFACVELLRMVEIYGDYQVLKPYLERHVSEVLGSF